MKKNLWILFLLLPNLVFSACEVQNHLTTPKNFKVTLFADDVPNARQMALGENGTVFVGSKKEGKVYAVVDKDNNGCADKTYVIAEDLNMPSGLAFKDGDLYVAAVSHVFRFDEIEKNLDNPPKPKIITDKLPDKSHHGWKFIDFGPDDNLYVPVGAPCNTCLEKDKVFGTILKMNPASGDWQIYAAGIRNSVGFAWHPQSKELWFTDNGRDWWGDDNPPDEINRVTRQGQHFGFPFVYGDDITDKEFYVNQDLKQFVKPALNLRAHVAPLGMMFYTGKQFPEKYHNQIIYAEHGSWNRSVPQGYRVATVLLDDNQVVGNEDLITGFLDEEKKVKGRPVAPLQMPDGSILISDDYLGVVYRLSYEGN